ncbi:MAG: hypothetical protein KA105_04845 [Caulobacter sp.]|nr:hypothetical protein [Caulobacter sp.]
MAQATAYAADDIFNVQIEAVQRDLEQGHHLDVNGLKPSGRLAVQALVEEGRARTAVEDDRLVVKQRKLPKLLRAFLLGATG